MTSTKNKKISSVDFDAAFDQGDVHEFLDLKSAKARYPAQRVTIDFPKSILEAVDLEAAKIGVTRTSLIKMWVANRLNIS